MKNIFKFVVTATTAVVIALFSRGVITTAEEELQLIPDMKSLSSFVETSENICKQFYEIRSKNSEQVYEEPAPVYEEPVPVYEEPIPVYEEPAPVYEEPVQVYEEPVPVYEEPVQDGCQYLWTISPYGTGKSTKNPPANLDLTVNVKIENGYRIYERSGMTVSEQDYILLCNLVGHEYGSAYVPDWERALCVEVVFNRSVSRGLSYYDVINEPYQFSGSSGYINNTEFTEFDHQYDSDFNGELQAHIKASVDYFFNFIEYFDEGYQYFTGNGSWNNFR